MTALQAARQLLDAYWDRLLPVKVERLAAYSGARVVVRGGALDAGFDHRGRVFWGGVMPLIEVNTYEPPLARRVIVAHELGHLVMGHRDSPPDTPTSFEAHASDWRDRDANDFAAAVLMPEEAVREAQAQRLPVEQMAQDFGVPVSAMLARLESLGL